MTTLLAIDPGVTTGYALCAFTDSDPLTLVEAGQIDRGVDGFVDWWQERWADDAPDFVVAEDFVDDGRTQKPNLMPLRILGALRVLHPGFISPRNTAMKHAPDPFLRKHGLYINGQRHARDAIRHAWAWVKVTKHRPSIERYWGRGR